VFWREGYAKTGIRELELASGLKAPSLYHRFGSKEALFRAALEHYVDVVVGMRIERYLKAADPLQGLRQFFHSTYDFANGDKPLFGCLLVNTSLEFGASEPHITAQLARGSQLIRGALCDTLRRAQRQKLLSPHASPTALADALHLGLQGLLVSCRSQADKSALKNSASALLALLPVTAPAHLRLPARPRASTRKD
jgi:TetR/AcrR family transcriptional regulator, transcriptional repressor for nem operon